MIPVTWNTVRLFIHIMAATIWVGGQITLATLVPGARAISSDLPRALANRFNRVAWPAYGVLVASGIWNIAVVGPNHDGDMAWWITLFVKLVVVAGSGISAVMHLRADSTVKLAVWGSLTGATAVGALWVGLMLHG